MTTWPSPTEWVKEVRSPKRVSPWPGPRPQDYRDGRDALVGRQDDLALFLQNITHRQLTHLIGPSGVGKTSLLQNGIVPELKERGYVVALCRDWSDIGDQRFEEFLARRLYDALDQEHKDAVDDQGAKRYSRNTDLFWELDDLGGSGVVVLDQFEELIRQGQTRRKEVFEFLAQVYLQTKVPVVLSYRSEYKEELSEFDRDMRIDDARTQRVEPVKPEYAVQLLQSPRKPEGAPADWTWESVISQKAVDRIAKLWADARQEDEHGRSTIGLLHLQALLFVLALSTDDLVDETTVQDLKREAEKADSSGPLGVLTFALEESATTLLEIGRTAAEGVEMDRYLLRGINTMLTRIVPHLSSGGYKLERQVVDLAETVLEDEVESVSRWLEGELKERQGLDVITFVRSAVTALITGATTVGRSADERAESLLDGSWEQIGVAVDRALTSAAAAPLGEDAWSELLGAEDRDDVTAGPMMGQSPLAALLEQLRRFTWAVLWLHELNLARLNAGSTSGTLTLVHDGLGDALQHWSRRVRSEDQTESLFALIAPEGESHEWFLPSYAKDLCGTPGAPRLHPNLRLRGNSVIGATFKHAVFVNCDFRGTFFLKCSFDDVVMLNCRLDGALFSDGKIAGSSSTGQGQGGEEREPSRDRAPSFAFEEELGRSTARELAQYTRATGTRLVAPEPGQPSYVAESAGAAVEWSDTDGGLKVQGCRLSALTFRGTTFLDATLAFVNVAGSGLDLAELAVQADSEGATRPRIVFRESVLRHTAFTGQRGDETAEVAVDVTIDGSVMAQCWIGAGVEGELTATGSLLSQWWVESSEFSATLGAGCTSVGNAGFAVGPGGGTPDVALPQPGAEDAAELEDFRVKSRLMDYRRN